MTGFLTTILHAHADIAPSLEFPEVTVSYMVAMTIRGLMPIGVLLAVCFPWHAMAGSHQLPADSLVSGSSHAETFLIQSDDTMLVLGHRFIIEGSEEVIVEGVRLRRGQGYLLDAGRGTVRILQEGESRDRVDRPLRSVVIRYAAFALKLPEKVQNRVPVMRIDSTSRDTQRVAIPVRPFTVDDLFDGKLKKSGSIVRGLSVGTNRDFSLTSGLRLQLSGSLADNVDVIAALTDENTPLQPEGTTQTLQEIDKVFVELRGTDVRATLGDFSLTAGGSTFGSLTRKVQGAKGEARYDAGIVRGDLFLSGAISRGKFYSARFPGIDGVQGPYRLRGRNNERDIIVIAGTERVYINGERLTRGETNDYTIEYGLAEITFTSKRLITQYSRITVDYEYNDRQFNRTLLAGSASFRTRNDELTFTASLFREQDDRDSPLDVVFTDEDREIMRSAGNDRSKAVRDGAIYVGPGKGQYSDTLVSGDDSTLQRVFRFAPSDTLNAVYAVSFSDVGQGKGDYRRVSTGHYEYVGRGKGAFLPIRFLPLPQAHTIGDFALAYAPIPDLGIDANVAVSRFDGNTYSAREDEKNSGAAASFGITLKPQHIAVSGVSLGKFGAGFRERYRGERFVPIDRIDDVEFDHAWGSPAEAAGREELREAQITYEPARSLNIGATLGRVMRGEEFTSNRTSAAISLSDSALPFVSYRVEHVRTENEAPGWRGRWLRQHADTRYRWGALSPGLRIESESRSITGETQDSLREGSFRFTEFLPEVSLSGRGMVTASAGAGFRTEDSVIAGGYSRASTALVTRWEWTLREWQALSSSLSLTTRSRKFEDDFRARGNQDNTTVLVRSQTRFAPMRRAIDVDLYYEVASERTAKLERVFQNVPRGTGNYEYAGDLNGNLIRDEEDYRPVRFDGEYIALLLPSDELVPTTGLKASTRLRLSGKRLVQGTEFWSRIIASLSSETYARVEEKNSGEEPRKIYTLDFSRFLNDRTTITGSNLFSQDLHLFELDPDFSVRFRYSGRHGLTQFARQRERTFARERSARVRWQPLREIGLEIDAALKDDNLSSNPAGYRERRVRSALVTTDWSYRPQQTLELGFVIGGGKATNNDTTTAYLNTQSVRVVFALTEQGQLRAEFSREEVLVSGRATLLPYELTGGRFAGIAWLWKCSAEYRLSGFLQMTLNYDGRSESGNAPVHSARGEVRAFF